MTTNKTESYLDWLIENYFSDSSRLLWLKEGEYLLKRGQYNSRLYLVKSGRLKGHVEQEDGSIAETLTAEKNHFIGVYSFFSRNYKSIATIQATTDCEIAFIDRHTQFIPTEDAPCLEKQFMPGKMTCLKRTQGTVQAAGEMYLPETIPPRQEQRKGAEHL